MGEARHEHIQFAEVKRAHDAENVNVWYAYLVYVQD